MGCGCGRCIIGLTLPDLDKGIVYRFASGGIQDSKVHEEVYSPVTVAMRTERRYAQGNAYV